jgi:iron only hydrogenase large subunit-like protein
MGHYFHSVHIDTEKCDGRMKCMRVCPTQAIRVRNGTALILDDKCIDCGECLTECPNGAIIPLTDPVGELSRFKYTVAIPSPALYAQFGRKILPNEILAGLKKLGFDDTVDLALLCGEVSVAIQEHLKAYEGPKPIISNACPTVVRLIQVKYPSLVDHISPIDIPREIAAREVKRAKAQELGLREEEIGTFYITPCPVKMVSIRQPAEKEKSYLDGAISISDIYGPLLSAMNEDRRGEKSYREGLESVCILGIGWAIVGGICRTLKLKNSVAVSGLTEILEVFHDVERGKARNVDFLEAYSCWQGCVGGSLTVENRYVSYNKILKLIETLELEEIKASTDIKDVKKRYARNYFFRSGELEPRPIKPLDPDLATAIQKRKEKQDIYESLPKIDCGACGSPTCMTFAEDVVIGKAKLSDCLVQVAQESIRRSGRPIGSSGSKIVELKPPGHRTQGNKVDRKKR